MAQRPDLRVTVRPLLEALLNHMQNVPIKDIPKKSQEDVSAGVGTVV